MSLIVLYRSTGRAVEKLDPRAKITAAILLIAALLLTGSIVVKAAIVAVLLGMWLYSRLGLFLLSVTTLSLSFFFITTMILRAVILPREATDLIHVGSLAFSQAGIVDGASMCLQILGVVLSLSLLVRTTAPTHLAEGGEQMLSPLSRVGFPAHEAAIMFTIALRFLPIMTREVGHIQQAQLARGNGNHQRSLISRLKTVLPLVIPFIIVSLVRAKELAEAMEARGYHGADGRTTTREFRMRAADIVLMFGSVAVLGAAVFV